MSYLCYLSIFHVNSQKSVWLFQNLIGPCFIGGRVNTAWKVSIFWVFLVRILAHLEWILGISPYSVWMQENTDQKTSNTDNFDVVQNNPILQFQII